MLNRPRMQFFDWVIAAASLAVGVYLGVAVGLWLTLEGAAFWLMIGYVFIPFGLVFLLIYVMDDWADRFLWGAVKPKHMKRVKKPLALLLSFPAGLLIGAIGVPFGLSDLLV